MVETKEIKKETSLNEKKIGLLISVLGHVDHGKTSLTAGITGYCADLGLGERKRYDQIDNAPEEKKRGITIKTTHVKIETEKRMYSLVDCPGHADYVKNMITGASQTDGAIVCVAVTDGIMPQTKEHIMLISKIGVKNCVVYLNKMDMVDPQEADFMAELVEGEIKELIEVKYGMKIIDFIRGSARDALEGVDSPYGKPSIKKLLEALDQIPSPERNSNALPFMYIQEVLSVQGRGTIATGKVFQGTIEKGMPIVVFGLGKDLIETKVNSIEMFHKSHDRAVAGDNVGLSLPGVKRDSIEKGQILCAPQLATDKYVNNVFLAELYITTPEEGGRTNSFSESYKPQFYLQTSNISVTDLKFQLNSVGEQRLGVNPGDNLAVMIELQKPVFMMTGMGFVLRENNKTVAHGKIISVGEKEDQLKKLKEIRTQE